VIEYVVITTFAFIVLLTMFILGAAIPSVLLWHKTRECRHLINSLLENAGRKPVRASNAAKILGGGDIPISNGDKMTVERRPPPTAIDDIMKVAMQRDIDESKGG